MDPWKQGQKQNVGSLDIGCLEVPLIFGVFLSIFRLS